MEINFLTLEQNKKQKNCNRKLFVVIKKTYINIFFIKYLHVKI